jgi:lysozyme
MKKLLLFEFAFALSTICYSQDSNVESDYFMGSSIPVDSSITVNDVSLLSNENVKKGFYNFSGVDIKDHIKYGRYGIDISKWQGKVDWDKLLTDTLPDKVFYVIVKATQGETRVDPMFLVNYNETKVHGLLVGAYHFYDQTADPVAQANNFIKTAKLDKGDLMPILDIEKNCFINCSEISDILLPKVELIKNLKIFIDKIEKHYNTKVIIYTNEAFYNDYLSNDFKDSFFWIAKYSKTPPNCFTVGQIYSPANRCFVSCKKGCWQYTQSGKVKGVQTNVDLNFLDNFYLLKWVIK